MQWLHCQEHYTKSLALLYIKAIRNHKVNTTVTICKVLVTLLLKTINIYYLAGNKYYKAWTCYEAIQTMNPQRWMSPLWGVWNIPLTPSTRNVKLAAGPDDPNPTCTIFDTGQQTEATFMTYELTSLQDNILLFILLHEIQEKANSDLSPQFCDEIISCKKAQGTRKEHIKNRPSPTVWDNSKKTCKLIAYGSYLWR